jgi:septal ring factor EnvC (AmiA/AmiB activator)
MARGAVRASALVACAAGALAVFLGAANAQTTRNISQVERDRRAESTRAEQLRAQADAARGEVGVLDTRLVESGRRRAEAEAAATAAEARLAALQQQMDQAGIHRRNARDAFEAALITAAFAQHRIEPRVVRAGIFARAAAPAFSARERQSGQALTQAQNLAAQTTQERAILADAQAAIDVERTELTSLLARRRASQSQLASDAAAAERRARMFAAEARTLRELAQRVQPVAARRSAPGVTTIPVSWLAPAEGRITRGFGVRVGQGPASQGAILRTRAGAQVVSPAAGEVTYAGVFRSYGNVLILNLDGGYAVVLTGLEAVRARVGETVRAGQPIGEMPASDTPAPELYVEVRRNGQVVDPGRWLNARGLAAGSARTG